MKKLLMLLFSLTMVFATAAVVTACEEETTQPCTVHIDNDNNDICDVCQESLVPVVKEVNVSFTVKDYFEAPRGRSRMYLENAVAAEAATLAAQCGFEDPETRVVFLTEIHDTRFDDFSVLRPIADAE